MPPITLHMILARQIATDLDIDLLHGEPGPYLMGATSPDIRILTRQPRVETHFFALEDFGHQDSVASFFAEHDHLGEPEKLNEPTAAFVAGYLTHLVMDEQYITEIYRPVFLRHDELGGKLRANVMDRLLQFDLDREYGSDAATKQRLLEALAGTIEGIECGFIDHETLERWRQVCVDVAARGMDWERARGMIENHLRRSGIQTDGELRVFLDRLPELRRETRAHIADAEIDAFLEEATGAARTTIARYLGCA